DPIHVRRVVDTPDSPLAGDLLQELSCLQVNDIEAVVDRIRHEQPAALRVDREMVQPSAGPLRGMVRTRSSGGAPARAEGPMRAGRAVAQTVSSPAKHTRWRD